jgi:methionine-rich copper-binding protein CopC
MNSNMSKRFIATALLMAGLAINQQAQAHAHLESASPANQSVVETSPKQLILSFSEGVEPAFSGVELKDGGSKTIATGEATVDPADKKKMIIPLSTPLAQGKYEVDWHAVAEDGHKTKGSYEFNVK